MSDMGLYMVYVRCVEQGRLRRRKQIGRLLCCRAASCMPMRHHPSRTVSLIARINLGMATIWHDHDNGLSIRTVNNACACPNNTETVNKQSDPL